MKKQAYTIQDLLSIMARLRGEGGCPWDMAQTHDSIKYSMVEEAYEAIDALEKGNDPLFANELGDLLMQVVFHAQLAKERGAFSFDDVVYEICTKLIARHSHVFGTDAAQDEEQALATWERNKLKEKGLDSVTASMRDVIYALPALTRAAKVQKKAKTVGFEWPDASGALCKLKEELAELELALADGAQAKIDEELGDLLFSVVNLSRYVHTDAEEALRHATDKFIDRFALVEQYAQENGENLSKMPLKSLETLWQKAKIEKK